MRKPMKVLIVISAVIAGSAAAPALYAQSSGSDSSMGGGMMGMGQKSGMMEDCSRMMQSGDQDRSGEPNEQWRNDLPGAQKAPE